MGPFKSLKPIHVPKRRNSDNYPTLPTHKMSPSPSRESFDSEKQDPRDYDYSEDDSPYNGGSSADSSRQTSSSYASNQPMLKPVRRRVLRRSRNPFLRIPQKIMRWLCFAIGAAVVLFILMLVRASILDTRRLEQIGDQRKNGPKQWESFPFLSRYYGGIRTLIPQKQNIPEYPKPESQLVGPNDTASVIAHHAVPKSNAFNPYPDYEGESYLRFHAPVHECFLDETRKAKIPPLRYYEGRTAGFPDNIMGSYSLLDLPENICFDRYGRLGPYGHGYSLKKGGLASGKGGDMEGSDDVWSEVSQYDYRGVDFSAAQKRCYEKNAARFRSGKPGALPKRSDDDAIEGAVGSAAINAPVVSSKLVPRTAVVIRTWDSFDYREEDILYLRSLVSELSIGSGGEYDVHLLVQLKDESIPVFADEETYQAHLRKSVPAEFVGMARLWSETQMLMLYHGMEETWARGPGLPVHGVYRGLGLALQWWAKNHPEYDFVWQWEMDLRYSGHWYDLFSKLDRWTESQPRKLLWERNSRFYIPALHGSWEDFSHMVRLQTESGTESPLDIWKGIPGKAPVKAGPKGDKPIWGPERPADPKDWFETDSDPVPPTSIKDDKYTWGVGEAADLITLNPLFDPEGTTWGLRNDATGYNRTGGMPPRRVAIVTASRLSKRLLETMHRETAIKKHHAFPEMWAPLVALSHGYKAVYAPHPMFVDREWPLQYLGATMNGGRNGATGGNEHGVFGDREHNLLGFTWYYNAGFPGNLWKRWLGLKVDDLGGVGMETGEGAEGRMCIPPMLLHPIKEVDLPVEEIELGMGEMSDPDA